MDDSLTKRSRLAAALVAVVAWAGLAIQFRATVSLGNDAGATIWILVRFFTILTNLALALVATAEASGRRVPPLLFGGVALAMALVGIVYLVLLQGTVALQGDGARLADLVMHKVTPLLAALWWLLFAPKGRLTWSAPFLWALYPVAYLFYALARARADGVYPYPFIDLSQFGAATVAVNVAVIALGFVLAGLAMVAVDRRLGAPRAAG